MKAAIIGTLCSLGISSILWFGGFLLWQRTALERDTYQTRTIYLRSKASLLQGRIDLILKENDNLKIDIQLLRREAPVPTPAPKKINPC